jgi:nucleotide-binding universal stress UspA family protein
MVLGCHHRGHLAGLWAGSTTQWLLVHPPAPMLIARHGYPTRSVALCVDGSPHAQRALQAFWALPWAGDVAVHLVSVDDGSTDVERSLKVAGAALPAGIWPARVARLRGPARRELADFVRANQIDLVVMGTRGLTGLARMRVGSTVSQLLKDGSANLLIAHVPDPEMSGAR